MGYKLLGFIVWNGARWYVRRKYPDMPRKAAIAGGLAGALLIGGVVVQRRVQHGDE